MRGFSPQSAVFSPQSAACLPEAGRQLGECCMGVGRLLFWGCVFCQLFFGCKNESHRPATPAFYHWKTELKITAAERQYIDSLGVQRLYVKFFDVDRDATMGQPVPLAPVEIDTANLEGLEIVPTVFITNRTLLNLDEEGAVILASKIFQKIQSLLPPTRQSANKPTSQEIQFDCDWTQQTEEKYFTLLKTFKQQLTRDSSPTGQTPLIPPQRGKHSSSLLSATIRLHQIKYFKRTGVPPVDRGMLMFYNMGEVEDWETENSILDAALASQYLASGEIGKYPLPLDVALPLFRWGVVFRDGRLVHLVNGLGTEDLADSLRFIKIAANRFEVQKSTYLDGYYLYKGDRIRLEGVSAGQLEEAAELLGSSFPKSRRFRKTSPLTVAFYHLDTSTLKAFSYETLEKILEKF
jgi:hypothetical protein